MSEMLTLAALEADPDRFSPDRTTTVNEVDHVMAHLRRVRC